MKTNKNKSITLIGYPMDLGADRRGVDMGPSALRYAGIREKLSRLGYHVQDEGNVVVHSQETQKIGNEKMKYLNEIKRTSAELAVKVESILAGKSFPLCLGGDHTIAIGSIAGASSWCRKNNLKIGVLWIDAHTDMNTPETTPSGNIHGMPLAISMGSGEAELVNLMGFSPKVTGDRVKIIGIRSVDKREKQNILSLNPSVYTMADIDKEGIHAIVERVIREFHNGVDHLHVSLDIDSLDPSIAPGAGTPVMGGLTFREAHLLMESIAESGLLCSMDITEINPIIDHRNQSAELAVSLAASALGQIIL